MTRGGAVISFLAGLLLSCTTTKPSMVKHTQVELTGLAGAWRKVHVAAHPGSWESLFEFEPGHWEGGSPTLGPGDGVLFGYAVANGSTLRGRLRAHGGPALVHVRLVSETGTEVFPLWSGQVGPGESATEFSARVPEGGQWAGVIISAAAGGERGRVTVESLLNEREVVGDHRPHLILVTLDTFRADHLSCLNPLAAPTPILDSLAASGVLFERAVSTSQCTGPSHASMLTGLYCFAHGVYTNRQGLSDEATTIAEILHKHGYRTLGAVSIAHLNPSISNLGQGFEMFLESTWPGVGGEPAEVQTARVLHALRRARPDSRPWFMWIHYFDPHTPYDPPEMAEACPRPGDMGTVAYMPGMGGVAHSEETGLVLDPPGEVQRYCAEVVYLDKYLLPLFQGLQRLGIMDDAVVLIVADHGESLGEHGIFFEHAGMFQEVLHVPLIILGRDIPRGVRIRTRVSGVDVFPTLLARAGIKPPPNYGKDLLRVLTRKKDETRILFAESARGSIRAAWQGSLKAVWVPEGSESDWSVPEREMLFDLGLDLHEAHNLRWISPARFHALRQAFGDATKRPLASYAPIVSSQDMARLKALGYVE